MKRHPLCELFPPMAQDQFDDLVASMKEHGFDPAFPIITYEDMILDGANRWRAAEKVGVRPVLRAYEGDSPLRFVVAANLNRRHLDESQRALIGAKLATLKGGQNKAFPDAAPIGAAALSRAEAAELLNVGTRNVTRARRVLDQAIPELIRNVERGRITVNAASILARLPREEQLAIATASDEDLKELMRDGKRRAKVIPKAPREKKLVLIGQREKLDTRPRSYYTAADWEGLSAAERQRIIAEGFEATSGTLNAQVGDAIEWARWSHNTVTGCEHNCPYCYARDIANRIYEPKFTPAFWPARLAGPARTPFPTADERRDYSYGNIFANSMSDLFGSWVPAEWIEATLDMARRNPRWRFLTLTKFPQRAVEFTFPDNVWMGTTVDAQARVANAEKAFAKIRCKTKWLSCEPLLEPLQFTELGLFQWVVIGGASVSEKTPEWVPPIDWVLALHQAARAAGCRIYYKTNLAVGDGIRPREFPWLTPKPRLLPRAFHYLKGLGTR
jgi:protein gp37